MTMSLPLSCIVTEKCDSVTGTVRVTATRLPCCDEDLSPRASSSTPRVSNC